MLLVHMTWSNVADLALTGLVFGFGWAAGSWLCGKTLGRL